MSGITTDVFAELRARGFIKQCSDEAGLQKALASGPMAFYAGFDPTGPSLHIGHMVPVFLMAHLARAGHKPLALVGGGTARIGDPSGKTEMRKMLSVEQIDQNAASIGKQLSAFLDRAGAGAAVTMVNNADWLAGLNYIEFLREIGVHFSVNRMLTFEAYKIRMETGLSFIEFNYQLLQSYDFLTLYRTRGCRLQIGGDDQWGNIVSGSDLIRRVHAGEKFEDAYAMTCPLIMTSDGKKMGKTEKGSLFLDPAVSPPIDLFQYWRNVPDVDAVRFLKMFTFLSLEEIKDYEGLKDAEINRTKERLAYEFVALIHGKSVADECLAAAKAAFAGGSSANLETVATLEIAAATVSANTGPSIVDLLVEVGFAPSRGEAKRLIQQGGISLGETKLGDIAALLTAELWESVKESDGSVLLRAGKKRFHRLVRT